jgi:hypothetical protein
MEQKDLYSWVAILVVVVVPSRGVLICQLLQHDKCERRVKGLVILCGMVVCTQGGIASRLPNWLAVLVVG